MLNNNYYLTNALNCQMMVEHFQSAANPQGRLGDRVLHAMLGVLELPPVIGQITTIFGLAVVKIFVLTDDEKIWKSKWNAVVKELDEKNKNPQGVGSDSEDVFNTIDPAVKQLDEKNKNPRKVGSDSEDVFNTVDIDDCKNACIAGAAEGAFAALSVVIGVMTYVNGFFPINHLIHGKPEGWSPLSLALAIGVGCGATYESKMGLRYLFSVIVPSEIANHPVESEGLGALVGAMAGISALLLAPEPRCLPSITWTSICLIVTPMVVGGVIEAFFSTTLALHKRNLTLLKKQNLT